MGVKMQARCGSGVASRPPSRLPHLRLSRGCMSPYHLPMRHHRTHGHRRACVEHSLQTLCTLGHDNTANGQASSLNYWHFCLHFRLLDRSLASRLYAAVHRCMPEETLEGSRSCASCRRAVTPFPTLLWQLLPLPCALPSSCLACIEPCPCASAAPEDAEGLWMCAGLRRHRTHGEA